MRKGVIEFLPELLGAWRMQDYKVRNRDGAAGNRRRYPRLIEVGPMGRQRAPACGPPWRFPNISRTVRGLALATLLGLRYP